MMLRASFLLFLLGASHSQGEVRTFKVTFYCSCQICTGKNSPSLRGSGNTATGRVPIPFRTVAVGDPSLLGKWIYFEDLGGWVLASDTGARCTVTKVTQVVRAILSYPFTLGKGCVSRDQVDVFVGGPSMHKRALEMGVQEWKGRVMETQEAMAQDSPTRRVDE